jgi:hypothetical protein
MSVFPAVFERHVLCPLSGFVLWRNSMTWLFIAIIVVAGFALLKVRRRRKARDAGSSYAESKAA